MCDISNNDDIVIVVAIPHPSMTRTSVLNNPNKDANPEWIPILLVPTGLQRKILRHLCTTENASYETLTKIGKLTLP
ncbi:MAG: hypothetical protein WA667_25960 [Candidatus Nitrosopolaris sp.]